MAGGKEMTTTKKLGVEEKLGRSHRWLGNSGCRSVTSDFKAKIRCSSYICRGSSCHTYSQNVNIETNVFIISYLITKTYYKSRKN
jgi:hypothetical protein